ncbi:hypothetical protein LEMLEM_LOCUS4747 [Lemmus lemmus]
MRAILVVHKSCYSEMFIWCSRGKPSTERKHSQSVF